MIFKISGRTGFGELMKYLKQAIKQDRVLSAVGIPDDDPKQMVEMFEWQASQNKRIKINAGHGSLSWSPKDAHKFEGEDGDQYMNELAEEFLDGWLAELYRQEEIKLTRDDMQYAIIRHNDKLHPHCHIIFNRVDNNFKKIRDFREAWKGKQVATFIREKHKLSYPKETDYIKKTAYQELSPDELKHVIHRRVAEAVQYSTDLRTFEGYLGRLAVEDEFYDGLSIYVEKVFRGNTDEIQGLKFCVEKLYDNYGNPILDEKGRQLYKHAFKASNLNQKFGYSKLLAIFEQNRKRLESQQKQSREDVIIGDSYKLNAKQMLELLQKKELIVEGVNVGGRTGTAILKIDENNKVEKQYQFPKDETSEAMGFDIGDIHSVGKNDLSGGRRNEVVDDSDKKKPKKKQVVYKTSWSS
jgi:hypothetical protein